MPYRTALALRITLILLATSLTAWAEPLSSSEAETSAEEEGAAGTTPEEEAFGGAADIDEAPREAETQDAPLAPDDQGESVAQKPAAPRARARASVRIGAKFELSTWPSSHHPPHSRGPSSEPAVFVHAFSDGGAAIETEAGRLIDADDRTVLIDANPGRLYCAAGRHPNVACLRNHSVYNDNGEHVASELWLHQTGQSARRLSRVGPKGSIAALGVHVDDGPVSYLFSDYSGAKNAPTVTHWSWAGSHTQVQFDADNPWLRDLGGGRPNAPVRFVSFKGEPLAIYRVDDQLYAKSASNIAANAAPNAVSGETKSVYEFRAVVGADGVLYVFFHEPLSKSIHVATSRDGHQFNVHKLDKGETGTQLEAFADETGVYAAYYYHTNQFDRGVRLITASHAGLEHKPCTLVREEKHNVGWGLGFARSRNGAVWLTYFDPVEEGRRQRVWSRQTMVSLKEEHCVDVMLADLNDLNINAGVGVWYDNWHVYGGSLKAEDNGGVAVGGTEYKVEPALLTTVALEARFKQLHIGLQYGKELLREDLQRFERYSRLGGHFKIADLLLGHDIRLEGAYGHYKGSMTPGDGVTGESSDFETRYADVHLYAVNTWRIKYGLTFTRYEMPVPVHVYTSGQGQTAYTYEGSFVRDAAVNIGAFMIGASKLDYIAKYENHYNDFFLDGSFGFGLAFASFDEPIPTTAGDVTEASDFVMRARAMSGWLFMHRFRDVGGLGFYLRPAHMFDGFLLAGGKPDDRKKKDDDDTLDPDSDASTNVSALHHGPWFDLGVLW